MSAHHIPVEELRATFDEKAIIILYFVTSTLFFALLTVIRVSVYAYICVFVCLQSDMLPYCTPHNKLKSPY